MTNYQRMIEDELGGGTPKSQYEILMQIQEDRTNLYSKVEQAKTLLRGLLTPPVPDGIESILRANWKTIAGTEWEDEMDNEIRIDAFHQKLP
jgi:hypothetical protein